MILAIVHSSGRVKCLVLKHRMRKKGQQKVSNEQKDVVAWYYIMSEH